MVNFKTLNAKHLTAVSFRDIIEILFGVLFGLLIFLGASELWNIGAVMNDFMVVGVVGINIILLYFLTKFIAGKVHRSSLFLESVRHPLERSGIVYIIGFFVSLSTILWLNDTGVLKSFVELSAIGFFPTVLRITVLANLFATLFATTIDLAIAD